MKAMLVNEQIKMLDPSENKNNEQPYFEIEPEISKIFNYLNEVINFFKL